MTILRKWISNVKRNVKCSHFNVLKNLNNRYNILCRSFYIQHFMAIWQLSIYIPLCTALTYSFLFVFTTTCGNKWKSKSIMNDDEPKILEIYLVFLTKLWKVLLRKLDKFPDLKTYDSVLSRTTKIYRKQSASITEFNCNVCNAAWETSPLQQFTLKGNTRLHISLTWNRTEGFTDSKAMGTKQTSLDC